MKRLAYALPWLLLTAPAGAATATLMQPPASERGLQLEAASGRAWMLRPNGQRLRLPLRSGERIDELIEFDNGWVAAGGRAVGERQELVVIVDGAAGVERLRTVPEPIGALRVRPAPMASSSGFEGLAWLEGDTPQGFEVRADSWNGAEWSAPTTVSAGRATGRAGLVGMVLDDGRWLLVWSESNGRDTDLVWSVRQGSRWSKPRLLAPANDVPDVTPSLVRVPGGALIVWAQRQPSGYQLRTARFGDGWSTPRPLGPLHASFPRFADLAEAGRFLTHRLPTGWATVEIDADGRELRRATSPAEQLDRPVLTSAGGGIGLRWRRGDRPSPLHWGAGTP